MAGLIPNSQSTLDSEVHLSAQGMKQAVFVCLSARIRWPRFPCLEVQALTPLCLSRTLPDSTTAFVGQCFVDHRGKETLETTWLLREEVPSRKDTWKATR